MNKPIEVSVIIPVYNIEHYLEQCLDSVINQTFQNMEIIIINDCSTDGSYKIIQQYQQKDKRIIAINLKSNMGLGNARNEGLKVATGKYIVFADSDDWVTKDYVKVLYDNIEQYECDVIIADYYTFNNKTGKVKPFKQLAKFYYNLIDCVEKKQQLLTLRMIWSTWSKIFNRKFLVDKNITFQTNKMEDIFFVYKVILNAKNLILINIPLYYYRINRKDSIMSNKTDRIYHCIEVASQIKKLLVSENLYNTYKQSFYSYILILFAAEFEVSKLSLETLKYIAKNIKHEFFEDMKIKLPKTSDKFLYQLRINFFYYCLKYNINYGLFGKISRKFYEYFFGV